MSRQMSRLPGARARRRATRITAAVALVVVLGACGGRADQTDEDASTSPGSSESTGAGAGEAGTVLDPSEAPDATTVAVEIADGDVTPVAEVLEVSVGEPVTFEVTTDVAAELHAHTSAEGLSLEFEPGTSAQTISLDRPGSYEVELHDPAVLVVRLDVRG